MCDLNDVDDGNLLTKQIRVLNCEMTCRLKDVKWNKFRFKFKKGNKKCDLFEVFEEVIRLNKKEMIKLNKLSKDRWRSDEIRRRQKGEDSFRKTDERNGNMLVDIMDEDKIKERKMTQGKRFLLNKTNQFLTFKELKINVGDNDSRDMFTEGGRNYLVSCSLCTEDRRTTLVGHNCEFLLKKDSQKVHGEGICWGLNLVSAVNGIVSEIEIDSNARNRMFIRMFHNGQNVGNWFCREEMKRSMCMRDQNYVLLMLDSGKNDDQRGLINVGKRKKKVLWICSFHYNVVQERRF
jgi:hypothetical protein